jgi:hypothetical protein
MAVPVAVAAAIDAGMDKDAEAIVELLAGRPQGEVPPFLRAQLSRARALIAGARGETENVARSLLSAEAALRDLGYPYWAALTQLETAEWLASDGDLAEAGRLAGQAAATFQVVGAGTMLDRSRRLFSGAYVPAESVSS